MNQHQAVRDVNEAAIIAWLQQQAIPLTHNEAGNGFADLQPLKSLLQDATVVGLGEATHGTREFIQIKHRLFEFLVAELGFRLFTIEASYAACQPINAYVLSGEGNLADVLTGQWYIPWDTEEFAEFVAWIRSYNQQVPEDQRVHFYGVDINRNDFGRQAVLALLEAVDPERVPAVTALFAAQAAEEVKWPVRIDEAANQTIASLFPHIHALSEHLKANTKRFARLTSPSVVDDAIQYMRVMEQWLLANAGNALPPEATTMATRSVFMAENLLWLMEQKFPGVKGVVWQHNVHIAHEDLKNTKPNLGSILHERYAEQYFALGLEFGHGSFLTRTFLPDGWLGDLKIVTLPPAPATSLPWYLSQVGHNTLALNLHGSTDETVRTWLHTPRMMYSAGWIPGDDETFEEEWDVTRMYDAIIFVSSTTPIRPTANAQRAVAQRDGL